MTRSDTANTPSKSGQPSAQHQHEWAVFSTARADRLLMVQCIGCALHGTVEHSSREEWSRAHEAPSRPYRWHDDSRVRIKGLRYGGRLCVARAGRGECCEFYSVRVILQPEEYERVPVDFIRPAAPLADGDKASLETLAKAAINHRLCSLLLALSLDSYTEYTGVEVPGPVYRIALRLQKLDAMGLHCSPLVVARLLREYARE